MLLASEVEGIEITREGFLKYKVCSRCSAKVRVAYGGRWGVAEDIVRCECVDEEDNYRPLVPDIADAPREVLPTALAGMQEGRRRSRAEQRWNMVETGIARAENREHAIKLTDADVRMICPTATEEERHTFVRFCLALGLNPYLNEAYLVKYKNQPAYIHIGQDTFLKRAQNSSRLDYMEYGVITQTRQDDLEDQVGAIVPPGHTLFGGWIEIGLKDRQKPIQHRVMLREYDRKQALWNDKPASMIMKVAVTQGIKRAFPSETQELFDVEGATVEVAEIDSRSGVSEPIEATARVEDPDPAPPVEAPAPEQPDSDTGELPSAADASPWGDGDPLVACWVHGEQWQYQEGHGKKYASHPIGGGEWCRFTTHMREALGSMIPDTNDQNAFSKQHFDRPWSGLSPAEQYELVRKAKAEQIEAEGLIAATE